jgi:hypothetical protein
MAFRDWALAHPNLFRLVFAMPDTGLVADPAVAPAGQAGLTQVRNRVERARAAGLLADRPASEVTVEWHALCVGLASVELGGALMNAAKAERMWRGSLTAAAGGCPGTRSGTLPRFRRSQACARIGQDGKGVRIYASEQCPRQDSNLRSRLRRPLPYDAPTWQNAPFPSGWGACGERQGANPCRNGGQAASVPGSVKASRWSPKSAMISRRPPRAST